MKALEEEWELNDYGGLHVWVNGEPGNSTHVAEFKDEARALLAAQAPAMARLIAAVTYRCACGGSLCIDCEATVLLRAAGVIE